MVFSPPKWLRFTREQREFRRALRSVREGASMESVRAALGDPNHTVRDDSIDLDTWEYERGTYWGWGKVAYRGWAHTLCVGFRDGGYVCAWWRYTPPEDR